MSFRVELTESATDEQRGFLGSEDDENPNSNVKVREFDSADEARQAIQDEIARDDATEFAFHVIDEAGETVETTYFDDVYGCWESFN
jgi:hypothetical protein